METDGDTKKEGVVVGNIKTTPVKTKREIQYKYWIFTYNNYDDNIIMEIKKYLDEVCEKYLFQEELGEKTGTKHLQGIFHLKKKTRYSEIMDNPIHYSFLEKSNSIKNNDYCQKDKTRNGNRWVKGIVILDIITKEQFYDWQLELFKILIDKPDKRKIYWYWESKGNTGKSAFIKYMVYNYKALFTNGGKESDIINLVYNQLDVDREPNIIFWDLPRHNKGKISYSALECIKNGMIQNNKYETGTKLFNSPHIVIFSNYEPCDTENLSNDRWVIKELP